MNTLKGGRMKLEGATLSHTAGEEKFQVQTKGVMAKGPAQPSTITTKFKAGSPKEAADWALAIQNAINGKSGNASALPGAQSGLSSSSINITTTAAVAAPAPDASAPAAPAPVKATKSKSRGNFFSSFLPTARSPTTPRSPKGTEADTTAPPVSVEKLAQLRGLTARLGVAAGLADTLDSLPCAPSTAAQAAAQLEKLVEHAERCADAVAYTRLADLTERIEQRVGMPGVADKSQPQLSGGALTPTSAHLAELESLLTRMEAVV